MKLTELHVVEGDPVRGGCHVKQMNDVLELNRRAFLDGKERGMVVLSAQPTLELALAAERDLKRERREAAASEDGEQKTEGGVEPRNTPNTRKLEDSDPMPWGKHKDVPMQDVPASYMFWLWTEKAFENNRVDPVADYIRRNLSAFEDEYPDGIWRK